MALGTALAVVGWLVLAVVHGLLATPCRRAGHVWRTHYTPTRLYLTCPACGTQSPGWELFIVPTGCQRFSEVT